MLGIKKEKIPFGQRKSKGSFGKKLSKGSFGKNISNDKIRASSAPQKETVLGKSSFSEHSRIKNKPVTYGMFGKTKKLLTENLKKI